MHVLFRDVSDYSLIHLQSKNKATLGNASNLKPKNLCEAWNNSVTQKSQKQNQDRQPCQTR